MTLMVYYTGLAENFVQVFPQDVMEEPLNELFGQASISLNHLI